MIILNDDKSVAHRALELVPNHMVGMRGVRCRAGQLFIDLNGSALLPPSG